MQTHEGNQSQFASDLSDHILGTSHITTLISLDSQLNMLFGTVDYACYYTHSLSGLRVSIRKIVFKISYNSNYIMLDNL
jgi:hypothetical protein